jgi:hypothetical protein
MWKLTFFLAVLAMGRYFKTDHNILAIISIVSAILVWWSAGVMDNIAHASRNYFGPPTTKLEVYVVNINMVVTFLIIGLFICCFFV